MNHNQLCLIRTLIEHSAIVEIDGVKAGYYECNEKGESFTVHMTTSEIDDVQDFLKNVVSTLPIKLK